MSLLASKFNSCSAICTAVYCCCNSTSGEFRTQVLAVSTGFSALSSEALFAPKKTARDVLIQPVGVLAHQRLKRIPILITSSWP
ncbi:hypothetical protein FWK35_00031018 [Aphis craccivora]|uniref:Uncharacterized protein n=1 Tax=Aphis craccivora TaxID=307492 RepID=A0A6G0ZI87_APHCR|nr:hypothetical protein FWK35_00031018 [Aphis craccivora]